MRRRGRGTSAEPNKNRKLSEIQHITIIAVDFPLIKKLDNYMAIGMVLVNHLVVFALVL